jgi:hypothetical protein
MRAVMDAATGDLALDTGEVIGAGLTRSALLASPLGAGVASPPPSYIGLGRQPIGGETFVVGLGFDGETLRTATLTMVQASEGASWDDWSADAELARKARHDAWLERHLGSLPWWFAWGAVASEYDGRGGSSSVRVCYGAKPRIACSLGMDPATGDIVLGIGDRVGSGLTRTAFLSSALAVGRSPLTPAGAAAQRAAFPVELRLPGGGAATLNLHFDGEALAMVVMSMIADHEPPAAAYRSAWGDDQALARLVRDEELARKARHDGWLSRQLGPPPWSYPWGRASSELDAAACASLIIVAYR